MRTKKIFFTLLILILALSVMAPGLNVPSYYDLSRGKTVEYTAGRAGVSFVNSSLEGTVKVTRRPTNKLPGEEKPRFLFNPIEVRLYDADGASVKNVLGSVYVFFKVRQKELRMWELGQLSIYHYDTRELKWLPCKAYAVHDGSSVSTLACRIKYFGLYGLARK